MRKFGFNLHFEKVLLHQKALLSVFCIVPLLLLLSLAALAEAGNPFLGQRGAPKDNSQTAIQQQLPKEASGILSRVAFWQMRLHQSMGTYIHRYKTEGQFGPLIWLFGLALAYGTIHAAGPGHGKAIAMAYAMAQKQRYSSSLFLGVLVALIHAASGVSVVVILRIVLERTISGGLDEITRVTQIVSYGLITLIGAAIVISTVATWYRKDRKNNNSASADKANRFHNPVLAALAIGMVPCPGVITITLFCFSLNQMILGLVMALLVSIGMAVTITLVVWTGLLGKNVALRISSRYSGAISHIEQALQAFSGLLLVSLGALLLAASV